ncbi:MAG: carbon-nitrogen hydrolase family protein [Deltaproteobacteria bacterium]|jgi:predicted amidohydrolase|nr:carbon-nitrogen hydrolase family protein [Deltaproteobacteria bacterium]MBW1748783.1 carbon-nitrogen hydrolase family protein [Deltaproteobacteria bacterium]MBW1827419.1 carbon-nitrogen hydrolase family protein [Deltaproteobacteria bacterium]MBW2156971.1 carbon-nitrogen hydrolase family protein [Deltaproteobacteria bacterium]MBW2226935.1 carbon-nitrogen hydrolase family protein [Deltaproteobacteria bacterium]
MKSPSKNGIIIAERFFSHDENNLSIGLANIHAVVPDVEANKEKMLQATQIFKERKVNVAIFPEFCLSGYFWEDENECRSYMDKAVIENHLEWIASALKPCLDEHLRAVVFNNIRRGREGKYLNSTMILAHDHDPLDADDTYDKTFLPPIEKVYTASGRDDHLVVDSPHGKFGFTTCYDVMFTHLLLEYSKIEEVDAVIQLASWRAMARRDYPEMNVKTDTYYGYLWDVIMAATAATNQIWVIACNAVGVNAMTGARFWGGSGIWAPSGLPLLQASRINEELLIAHNVDIKAHREFEKDDFNYAMDFKSVYRPIQGKRTFSRIGI